MICPICKKKSYFLQNIEWYIKWNFYDIYKCKECLCHHINMEDISKESYEEIYSAWNSVIWYDRYRDYAKSIWKQKDALQWLASAEDTYLPIYSFFKKNKNKNLKVLEIWCWLWYLTHSINQTWNKCIWVDLSKEAINNAKKFFPDGEYHVWDVFANKDILKDNLFDVIVATELIEHIDDYEKFFSSCNRYLKKWGTVILTTPNKWYYRKDAIRIWDLPPVHTVRFSYDTFQKIWEIYDFDIATYNYSLNSKSSNLLFAKFYNNFILKSILSQPHQISYTQDIVLKKNKIISYINFFQKLFIIRKISNMLCYTFYGNKWSHFTLWIYLTKK